MATKRTPDIFHAFARLRHFSAGLTDEQRISHDKYQVDSVIDRLIDYREAVERTINTTPGLKIASDFQLHRTDIVAKNIAWLTSLSVLRLPPITFPGDADDPTTFGELLQVKRMISQTIAPFWWLCNEGILLPYPTFDPPGLLKDVLNVGFSNEYLASQMSEHGRGPFPAGVLELLLPRVASVPQGEILTLRKDNAELFTHFQCEITDFLRSSDAASSEASLVDLLLHIDQQVARLRNEFERLDKKKSLEKMGLAYSFGVMSLVLFLPTEIFKSFAALLGSTSSLKALRNIRLLHIEGRQLADDPFYLPYKLSKMARDLAESET
ncbi:MAG: hypothetical protein ACHQ9S_11630 [Candidatus Binatia bacterium]